MAALWSSSYCFTTFKQCQTHPNLGKADVVQFGIGTLLILLGPGGLSLVASLANVCHVRNNFAVVKISANRFFEEQWLSWCFSNLPAILMSPISYPPMSPVDSNHPSPGSGSQNCRSTRWCPPTLCWSMFTPSSSAYMIIYIYIIYI